MARRILFTDAPPKRVILTDAPAARITPEMFAAAIGAVPIGPAPKPGGPPFAHLARARTAATSNRQEQKSGERKYEGSVDGGGAPQEKKFKRISRNAALAVGHFISRRELSELQTGNAPKIDRGGLAPEPVPSLTAIEKAEVDQRSLGLKKGR